MRGLLAFNRSSFLELPPCHWFQFLESKYLTAWMKLGGPAYAGA
jgi:hypothetical protein